MATGAEFRYMGGCWMKPDPIIFGFCSKVQNFSLKKNFKNLNATIYLDTEEGWCSP